MALRTAGRAAPLAAPFAALVALLAFLALAAPEAAAKTLRVPSEDYGTIQEAVDASSDGDTILVAAGIYSSSVAVSGRNNLKIRGVEGTVLDSSGIYLSDCERVTLDGIEFVDATDTGLAVHATDCPRLTLKNLRIEGYDGVQILLEGCDGARVTKCTVVDGPGVGLRDAGSTDLVVDRCTFTGNAGWAIDLSTGGEVGSDRAKVSKNIVTGPESGIAADGADLRIEGNTVTLEGGIGILVGSVLAAADPLVQKNTVALPGTSSRGIDVLATLGRVARNAVTGANGVGVFVEGTGTRIEGNTTLGSVIQAFHCDGNDLRITGNLAQSAVSLGFHIAQGSGSTVTRNRSLDSGNTGFQVTQPNAVLAKNVAEGAVVGFDLGAVPMTLTGNAGEGNSYTDVLSVFSESQYVLSKNRFETFIWDYVIENPV